MNLENIEIGKEYKNKGELCELLGVKKAVGGRNIKLQDEEFARYFKFEKTTGHKVKVTEIYDTPKEKIDGRGKSEGSRGNNEGFYIKHSEPLLLHYFQCCRSNGKYVMYTTTNQLAQIINVVNYNYSTANNNRKKYNTYMYNKNKFTNYTAKKDVFEALNEIVKPVIVGTLEKLQEKGYIEYAQTYLVHYTSEIEDKTEKDIRVATDEEIEIIKQVEKLILDKMELESTKQLQNNSELKKQFYRETSEISIKRIKEELDEEIDFYYVGYKIRILYREEEIKIENIKETNLILNSTVIERAMKKIHRKMDKVKEEKGDYFGAVNPFWPRWDKDRLSINYLIESEEMIKSLVKIGYMVIREQIENTNVKKYIKSEEINFEEMKQEDYKKLYNDAKDEETRDIIKTLYLEDKEVPY